MTNHVTLTPQECRRLIASGAYTGPTSSMAPNYLQANLVILPLPLADDFRQFSKLNHQACPLLEVLPAGQKKIEVIANADVSTDFPAYRINRLGDAVTEATEVADIWQDDWVSFLIGCSYTTDQLLQNNGIPLKHVINQTTVPIYITQRPTRASHYFSGPLAVSMRTIKREHVSLAQEITGDYPLAHGAPVAISDENDLAIRDITKPDFGTFFPLEKDEVPVFWACGITPQLCFRANHLDVMITHKPGHMLICDLQYNQIFKKTSLP